MNIIPANPTSLWYLAQVFSLVSLIIIVIGTLNKNDTRMKQLGAIGTLLYGIAFAMVGGWVGAAMAIIGAARGFLASWEKTKFMAPLIFAIQLIAILVFWKGPLDLIAVVGSFIITYALFYSSGLALRIIFIPGPVLYIIYALLLGAPLNAMVNAVILSANFVTIYRLLQDKKAAL